MALIVLVYGLLINYVRSFEGKYELDSIPITSVTGTTYGSLFPYSIETLEIRACENSAGLTFFGLYQAEDGNTNLEGFGYETASGIGTIYRMNVLPLSAGTYLAEFEIDSSDSSITITLSDGDQYKATLITSTVPENYDCVLPHSSGSMVGLSATGPNAGDAVGGPPENIAIESETEACYFYEPDPLDKSLWHPGSVTGGILIADNIQIGEYQQSTSIESYGINLIVRYEETLFIEAFCRVSPRDSLDHVANHTQFCKTFSGLKLDAGYPYRSCPLCNLTDTTVDGCQQNLIITTTEALSTTEEGAAHKVFIQLFQWVIPLVLVILYN